MCPFLCTLIVANALTNIPDSHHWMSLISELWRIVAGNTVFIQGAAATPLELVKEMTDYGKSAGLKGVTVCHMHTEGVAGYTEPDCEGKTVPKNFR
jgi:hypothetical protein